LIAAVLASALLIGFYVAEGGGSYKPTKVADPCKPRELPSPDGLQATLERVALSAADGAACELGVTREDLVVALRSEAARKKFVAAHGLTDEQVDDAVRAGLRRAADDAQRAGTISGIENFILQRAIDNAPVGFIIDRIGRP